MKKLYLSLLASLMLLASAHETQAQNRIGLRLDNYQGINSVFANPANSSTQRLNWNLNLASAGVFGATDYAFFENASISDVINKTYFNRDEIGPDGTVDANESIVYDFDDTDSRKFAEVNGFATGPSFLGHIGDTRIGLFLNYRFHAAEQNLDSDLGYYTNQRIPLTENIGLERTQIAAAAWREIGFHFGKSFSKSWGEISFGTNLKYISGIEGLTFETNTVSELERLSLDEVSVQNLSIVASGTTSLIDNTDIGGTAKGSGFGVDIGFNVIFEETDGDYKFKLGVAMNDIGGINFDQGIESHVLQSTNPVVFDKNDFQQMNGLRDLIQRSSNAVLGSPTASAAPISSLKIGLPTSMVVNLDYKVLTGVYIGAMMVQRFPKTNVYLERSNLLAVSPRYESKWFGMAVPVTVLNYAKPNVGLSMRLAFLTFGTDHLGSLTKREKLSSGDAYFSLQLFSFGGNGLFNRLFEKSGGEEPQKCYEM